MSNSYEQNAVYETYPEMQPDMHKRIAVLGPYGGSEWLAEGLLDELRGRSDVREVTYTPLHVSMKDSPALQEAVRGAYVLAPSASMTSIRLHRPVGMKQLDAILSVEPKTTLQQIAGFARLEGHEVKHAMIGPDRAENIKLAIGKIGYIAMHPLIHLGPWNMRKIGETSTSETLLELQNSVAYRNSGVQFTQHVFFEGGDQMGFDLSQSQRDDLTSYGLRVRDLKKDYPDHEVFFRRPKMVTDQVYGPDPREFSK